MIYGDISVQKKISLHGVRKISQQSRIDYWLITRNLINDVNEVSIEPSVLTDHKAIFLSLNTAKPKDVKNSLIGK